MNSEQTKTQGHTPGPWTVQGKDIIYVPENDQPIITVAVPHGPAGKWSEVSQEHEANARLIAAAPEMLDFLKSLVYNGHLKSTCNYINDTDNCARCMAIDLIARAEGDQT